MTSRSARATVERSVSEDELLTAITEALSFLGYVWCHYRRSDKAILMGDPGLPDIVAARAGILWMIELKSETGRLEQGQLAWRLEFPVESHEFRYRLWRPSDLDVALRELSRG